MPRRAKQTGLSFGCKLFVALVVCFLFGLITPPLLTPASAADSTPTPSVGTEEKAGVEDIPEVAAEVCEEDVDNDEDEDRVPQQAHANTEAEPVPGGAPFFPCNNATLEQFWHEHPVPGLHIICVSSGTGPTTQKGILEVKYYRNAVPEKALKQNFPEPYLWKHVKFAMERKLDLNMQKATHGFQPWAIFTPVGQRVVDADTEEMVEDGEDLIIQVLLRYGTLLVFEGGQFMWPGVKIGFERPVSLYDIMPYGDPEMVMPKQVVLLKTLSLVPLVLAVEGFLTDKECNHIQDKADPRIEYSGVVLMDHDQGRPASDFRTSQSTFVAAAGDDVLMDIEYRVASLVRVPRQHQEDVQVLRYGLGEKCVLFELYLG